MIYLYVIYLSLKEVLKCDFDPGKEWGMSHMNEACHTWMYVTWLVTYEWGMSHVKKRCHIWLMSHVDVNMKELLTCGQTHTHTHTHTHTDTHTHTHTPWKSCWHVDESCHLWMSDVTHMNESCHTYEWVMSHIWMSHVTHTNESCHAYEWVMSRLWMSHDRYAVWPRLTSHGPYRFIYIYIHVHIYLYICI